VCGEKKAVGEIQIGFISSGEFGERAKGNGFAPQL